MAKSKVRADLRVVFGGQTAQVDAQTFVVSLLNMTTIVQEINQSLNPDTKVDMKIVALEDGSFIAGIDFSAVQGLVTSMFDQNNVQYAAGIVTILSGLFGLKKFLGKDAPKSVTVEGDGVKIENSKGQVQYFDNRVYHNYSKNTVVSDAISNSFTTLSEDPSVTDFKLLDAQEKPVFEVERQEFDNLAVKTETLEKDRQVIVNVANLNVLKIVLEPKRKWEFYHAGHKVSAEIVDSAFFERIKRGEEKFANGDVLEVELETTKVFDESVNTFVIHSYRVLKVIKHIPRDEQIRLDVGN